MKKTPVLVALAFACQAVTFATPSSSVPPVVSAALESGVASGKAEMFSIGKGVRKKKIAFFNVQVYEAELFVSNKGVFNQKVLEGTPLDALAKMERASIRLRFLRTLHADQVRESFSDALKVNQVDPNSPKMKEFFSTVVQTETFAEGKSVAISVDLTKGVLTFEDPEGKVTPIHGDSQLMLQLFSIWLGVPADSGLAELKKAFVTPTQT